MDLTGFALLGVNLLTPGRSWTPIRRCGGRITSKWSDYSVFSP